MSGRAMWQSFNVDLPLTANERLVLLTLGYFCRGDDNHCSPGLETICNKTGLTKHYVQQSILLLQQQKLIEVEQRRSATEPWKHSSNLYRLVFLKDWEKAEKEIDVFSL